MSKRHHTSRRRTYGRRQHELRERIDRRAGADRGDFVRDDQLDGASTDALPFLDPRSASLRFAMGD